jgi:hypothetical protein
LTAAFDRSLTAAVFDQLLDLIAVAKSFGFSNPPQAEKETDYNYILHNYFFL